MPRYAQLADGRTLEFPDNTTNEVIQRTVRNVLSQTAQPPAQPELEKSPIEDVLEEIPLVGDFLTGTADVGLGAIQGLAGVTGAATEAFGADNRVSRFFEDIAQGAQALMSAEERGDLAEGQRIMQEAEDKGILEQVKAAAKAFAKSPLTLGAQAVGSALPFVAATKLSGGLALPTLLGVGTGAGIVKGSIYDAVESEAIKEGLTQEQAAAMAETAQAYAGENIDQIALGSILGGVASRFGLERGVAKALGDKVSKNVLGRALATGTGEAVTEAAQAGQERLAGNLAAQRAGYDVPLGRGVAGQAALEGIMGGVAGAGASTVLGPRQAAAPYVGEDTADAPARKAELLDSLLKQGVPERQALAVVDGVAAYEAQERAKAKAAKDKAKKQPKTEQATLVEEAVEDEQATLVEEAVEDEQTTLVEEAVEDEQTTLVEESVSAPAEDNKQRFNRIKGELQARVREAGIGPTSTWVGSIADRLTKQEGAVTVEDYDAAIDEFLADNPFSTKGEDTRARPTSTEDEQVALVEEAETTAAAVPGQVVPKKRRGRPTEAARTEDFELQNKALELYPKKNQANPRDAWFNGASGVSLADYTAGLSRELTAASKKAFAEGAKWRESQAAPIATEEVAVAETPAVDRRAALAEAGRRFPEEGPLENAFYTGAIGDELTPGILAGLDSTGVKLAQQAFEQGVKWRTGQEGTTDEQPVESVADIESDGESVEPSLSASDRRVSGTAEAASEVEGLVGGGVDVSGSDVGVDTERGRVPQPALKGVPVTKVAPGVARGVKETRRGTQGTTRGAPVRGASELTAGMQAQQGLMAELNEARDRGEISDQDRAEIAGILRRPETKEEFAALPEEAQIAWTVGTDAQKNVDDRLAYIDGLKKELEIKRAKGKGGVTAVKNKLKQAEESLPALQKPLDATQEVVVDAARSELNRRKEERAETQIAIRSLLKDPNLTNAQRRDLEIALQENIVTLYEVAGGPEMSRRGFLVGTAAAVAASILPAPVTASPITINANLTALLEAGDINGALDWVAKNADNPLYKTIAKKIRQFGLGNTTLRVIGAASEQWNANGEVNLDRNTNSLLITLYGGKGRSVETFLHEAIHAYVIARWGMLRNSDAAIEKAGLSRGRGKAEIRKFQALWDSIGDAIMRHNPELLKGRARKIWASEFYSSPDEALSWVMTNSDLRTFLNSIDVEGEPLTPGAKSLWGRIVDYVRELFGMPPTPATNSALDVILASGMDILSAGQYVAPDARIVSEIGKLSPPQLFEKAEEDISTGLKKVQNSVEASDVAAGIQQAVDGAKEKYKLGFRAWWADTFGPIKLPKNFLVTSSIIRGLKDTAPAAGNIAEEIVDVTRQMRGMTDSMTRAAERLGVSLKKWTTSAEGNMQKMATAMQLARNNNNDPSAYASIEDNLKNDPPMKKIRSEQRKTKIPANKKKLKKSLDARTKHIKETWAEYNKLDAAGKAEYKKQREYYQAMDPALRVSLDGLIDFYIKDKQVAQTLRDKVRDMGVEEESEYEGVEASLLPNVYFPFMRFGDYAVVLRPPKGKKAKKGFARKRFHTDTPGEQIRLTEYLKQKYAAQIADGTYELTTPDMSELRAEDANESIILQQMFAAIDRIEMGGIKNTDVAAFKERARDSVYQVWLMTLPERSLRKQFIHADRVEGQSSDVNRVFASASTRYASQLPKLIARPQIDRLASEGKASFEGMSAVQDPIKAEKLKNAFNIVVARAEEELSPPPLSPFVRIANQTAFGLFMSNFMSAFLQTTAFPMQAMPRMLVRYGDQTGLMAKYIALIKDIPAMPIQETPGTGERYVAMPSIENTAFIKNNPLRKKLFEQFKLRGFMRQTYSSSVLGKMSRPSKSSLQSASELYNTAVSIVGAPVSALDQLTREMTTMMFAEMEYNKNGGDFEAAVKSAMKNTDETIGDYTDLEQFGAFRGNFGRFFRFLRSYSVQRAVYYLRQLKAIYKADPDLQQTKTEAFSELMLVSGMSALFGGAAAVAGYSAFTLMFSLMFGALYDDEEKKEFEERYPNSVVNGKLDADYHFRYVLIPNLFGEGSGLSTAVQKGVVSYALNADISSRVSQNDLFIRDWQDGDSTFDTAVNFATTNLSPQLSAGKGVLDGFDMIARGDFAKGVKKLTPGYVGNPLVAAEYKEEGMKTATGAPIFGPEEFNKEVDRGFDPDTVVALGAVPLDIGIERERLIQPMFERKREYKGRQQELMSSFKKEYLSRAPDQEELAEITQDIVEFNASLPAALAKDYLIDDKRMSESILRTLRVDRFRGYEVSDGEMLTQLMVEGKITPEQYNMLANMLLAERYK